MTEQEQYAQDRAELESAGKFSPDEINSALAELYPSIARREAIPGTDTGGPYTSAELPARAEAASETPDLMFRTVLPVAAALAFPGASRGMNPETAARAIGGIQAVGNVTATAFEDFLTNPDTQTISDTIDRIKRYGIEALGGYAGGYGGQKYATPAAEMFARRLAQFASNAPRDLKNWFLTKLTGEPHQLSPTSIGASAREGAERLSVGGKLYALTPRQLYGEKAGLLGNLEDYLRGAYGSGGFITKHIDRPMITAATKRIEEIVGEQMENLTPVGFGKSLHTLFNVEEEGFAGALSRTLYNDFRNTGTRVNYANLRARFIADEGVIGISGRGSRQAITAFNNIKKFLKEDVGTPSMTDRQLMEGEQYWTNVSANAALKIRRELNKLAFKSKNPTATESEIWKPLAETAKRDLYASAASQGPDATQSLFAADDFLSNWKDRVNQPLFKKLRTYMAQKPESVIGYFQGDEAATRYSQLMELKKAFTAGKRYTAALEPEAIPATSLGQTTYENAVLRPIRGSIIADAWGEDRLVGRRIIGSKLKATLDNLATRDPEFVAEVFRPEAFKELQQLANLLTQTELPVKKSTSIVMKLVQGGAAAGALSSAFGMWSGNFESFNKFGTEFLVLTFTPLAIATLANNPTRLKIINEGIIAGPGSKAFNRAIIQLGMANKEATTNFQALGQGAREFWTEPTPLSAPPTPPEAFTDRAVRLGREARGVQ